MDTDSAYMALSDTIHHIIKPPLQREFWTEYGNWFPRVACDIHQVEFVEAACKGETWKMHDCCKKVHKHDQRTPGLFKEEFYGEGIVALNSKTYYCWGEKEDKCKSKGLIRQQNNLSRDQFLSVLRNKVPVSGCNTGFMKRGGKMFTYSQNRNGLHIRILSVMS